MRTNRLIVFVAALAMGISASAQYGQYYYHVTGDTVITTPNNGYFAWWDFDYFNENGISVWVNYSNIWGGFKGVKVQKFFTPQPLRIIGLAGLPISNVTHSSGWGVPSPTQEYFYLYDYDTTGMVFKGRLAWSAADTVRRHIQFTNNGSARIDTCCFHNHTTAVYALREYYFDSAITVNDTFYVGGSFYSNFKASQPVDTVTNYYIAQAGAGIYVLHHYIPRNCEDMHYPDNDSVWASYHAQMHCYFPYIQYMHCSDTGTILHPEGNYTWQPYTELLAMLVYPIIEVDTTVPPTFLCDSVQNFEASMDSTGCLTLTWDDFLHYSYCEVEYYAVQDGEDSLRHVTVYGNMLTVCDLDTAKQWRAHVRAYCDTSKQETDWSPWIEAGYTTPYNPVGVGSPSDLSRFTSVMPNPATKSATVTSCFGMRRVEVYNMRGMLVYIEGTPQYTTKRIDLTGWAPGQYIVMIETPAGKTAKRLTVVR